VGRVLKNQHSGPGSGHQGTFFLVSVSLSPASTPFSLVNNTMLSRCFLLLYRPLCCSRIGPLRSSQQHCTVRYVFHYQVYYPCTDALRTLSLYLAGDVT